MNLVTDATVELEPSLERYMPGSPLRVIYRVDDEAVDRVEISLGYHTEGKGDEDSGVVLLEQRDEREGIVDFTLPNSPISYDGELIKIRWLLRVRGFHGAERLEPYAVEIAIGHAEAG
jgi:hypothetical protein